MGESLLINHYGSTFTPTSSIIPGTEPVTACASAISNGIRHQTYATEDALAGFALEAINNHEWHNYYNAANCSHNAVQNLVAPSHQPTVVPQQTANIQGNTATNNNVPLPTNDPVAQPKPKNKRYRRKPGDGPPKKRQRNPEGWTRVIKSKNYNLGKMKKLNGEVRPRQVKGTCMDPVKCRIKCTSKITATEQEILNNTFWSLGSFVKRREYLNTHVFQFEKNRARSLYHISKRNRQYTYKYFVTLNDERIQVCKQFFLNTFDISDRMVHCGSTSMVVPGAKKPKRQPKDTPTEEQRNATKLHIQKYLVGTVNRSPKIKDKEPHLTISDMYRNYKTWFKDRNYADSGKVGKPMYRKIFLQGIKMGFHVMGPLPKKLETKDAEGNSNEPAETSTPKKSSAVAKNRNEESEGSGSETENDNDANSNADGSSDSEGVENPSSNSKKYSSPRGKNKVTGGMKTSFNSGKVQMFMRSGVKRAAAVKSAAAIRAEKDASSGESSGSETSQASNNEDENSTTQPSTSNCGNDVTDRGDEATASASSIDEAQKLLMAASKRDRSREYNLGMIKTLRGNIRPRKVRGICAALDKCRLKCGHNISPMQQDIINANFWAMGSLALRRSYLAARVSRFWKKTTTFSTGQRERKFSYNYYFEINEERIQVCKSFFLNTLDISDRMVHDACEIEALSIFTAPETKRVPVNKTKPESIDIVKTHIAFYVGSFMGSMEHNPNPSPNKKDDTLNVTEMYRQYETWFANCNYNLDLKVKQHMYRRIYHQNFNIENAKGAGGPNLKRPTVISLRNTPE